MDLVSATQITLFRECERKWAWRYIEGIKPPQHPAAALGTEVDDTQLQPYLRDERPLDFSRESGYIAAAGLAYLPKPKTLGLEVQKHFVIPSPTFVDGKHVGFGFQGYLDLWLPVGGMPDTPPGPPGLIIPSVNDFKTAGTWKYIKTAPVEDPLAGTLATDVQGMLYATWAMWFTKARTVDLNWIYFATKGPRKAKKVHLRVHSDHVAKQFLDINDTAVEMYGIRKSVTDPLTLKPNVDMCEAYGGCPYRDKCNLSPGEIVDAKAAQWARKMEAPVANTTQGGGTVGLLAKLRAQRAAVTGETPVVALGINPPESLLPPAPPVGTVVVADFTPAANEAGAVKRGPGRPRKKDPVGADVTAHVTPAPEDPSKLLLATTPGPATIQHPEFTGSFPISDEAVAITITWGKETISPVPYNSFEVGPFSATGYVRSGETYATASERIYADLAKFAEQAKAVKALSFRASLGGAK